MTREVEQRVPDTPIKVLFCIDKLVRGGTELQLIGLIEQLDRRYYQPYLLTLRATDPALVPVDCIHLNWDVPRLFSPSGLKALWSLKKWLCESRIDVVQTFFQDSTVFGGFAARWAKTPVRIACFRDMAFWSNRKQALLMRLACAQMTGYIANANVVLDHFSRLIGIDSSKGKVIGNGVDIDRLPYIRHEEPVQNIGIVGNMTRRVKRTDLFIKAAGRLSKVYPNLQWHIVGDGHLRPEMERLAEECGVRSHVVFTGRVDDVPGYLENLDIGIICSDSEGLSNAIIEYMFRGVATVATRVGGNVELVEDQVDGLLVSSDNDEALAEAIHRLVADPEFRLALTDRARKKVEAIYSWPNCVHEHDLFYRKLLLVSERSRPYAVR